MAQLTEKQLDALTYKEDATVVVGGTEFNGFVQDIDHKHGRVTVELE